jgi:hypothetical protein
LYTALSAAWPTRQELDAILAAPVATLGLFHGTIQICTPYATALHQDIPPPRDILKLPLPGAHPILVARELLVLGTYLQNMPRSFVAGQDEQHALFHGIMTRAVDTANSLVTSNDELVNSIEGVECIMIECMLHNNAGNLRRAWMAMRRAMLLAQTLGLHRRAGFKSAKFVEPESRRRLDPDYMWFRILNTDHYLSLMLGLPLGSTDQSFADPKVLERHSAIERLERVSSLAGAKIIQRNEAGRHDIGQTLEIDKLLQQGATNMPPQWWLPPSFDSSEMPDEKEVLGEKIRLMNQFAYFNVLVQLHLPYILRPSSQRQWDYSKTTAVNASREVLSRFVAFRHGNWGASYCRGVDFVAFTASTALCLLHIDAGRQLHGDPGTSSPNLLTHQRLSDRGILERTLAIMEDVERGPSDPITSRISGILRPLLAIEMMVSRGGAAYSAMSISTLPEAEGGLDTDDAGGDENMLQIPIPHFGIIKIQQSGISTVSFGLPSSAGRGSLHPSLPNLWGATSATTAAITEDSSIAQSGQGEPQALGDLSNNGEQDLYGLDDELLNEGDWALQGVDMAFFESLMRGSMEPHSLDAGMWTDS